MFIFVGEGIKTVIPENRIYKIQLVGKKISINYDGGEITYLNETEASVAPKIETVSLNYDSEELALEVLRKFYQACDKKSGAFYF